LTISDEVLARQAANQLVAAACVSKGVFWSRHEQAHKEATTREEAVAAAAPLVKICRSCPIVSECANWAALDSYTGIAAGTFWSKGKRRDVELVRNRAGRPLETEGQDPGEQLAS